MAKMGFRKMNEMIGRCDLLEPADPLNDKVKVSQVNSPFVHLPYYTLLTPKTLNNVCFSFFWVLQSCQER